MKMKRTHKNIAKLIKYWREKRGLKKSKVSVLCNYSDHGHFIQSVELGRYSIPVNKITLVAKALDIDYNLIVSSMVADYETSIRDLIKGQMSVKG